MRLGGNFSSAGALHAAQRMVEAGEAAPAPGGPKGGAVETGRPGTSVTFWHPGQRTFLPAALSGTVSFLPHSEQVKTIIYLLIARLPAPSGNKRPPVRNRGRLACGGSQNRR